MSFLLLLAVGLGIFVMVRLMNIVQLAAELSGENEEAEMKRDNKINGLVFKKFVPLHSSCGTNFSLSLSHDLSHISAISQSVRLAFRNAQFFSNVPHGHTLCE